MKCIFVSDLHGNQERYSNLFNIIEKEAPQAVFIGGDILPNAFTKKLKAFVVKTILEKIKKINKKVKTSFFIILGNDDPRSFEELFLNADKEKILHYVHNNTVKFHDYNITGYSFVPPTPFRLKDWEKYDVSRFVDVGAISPEEGTRTIDIPEDNKRYSTISEDLEKLSKKSPPNNTIYLFHSPPYNTNLDLADIKDKKVDYAPVDIHIGSIAIERFIKKYKPFLTLHGHAHESVTLSGKWMQKIGKTYCFTAAHDGPELALIRFDTNLLDSATRSLIKTF